MKILFIIALLSFAALAWAAFAVTRHVRKTADGNKQQMDDADIAEALSARLSGIARPPVDEHARAARTNKEHDALHFTDDAENQIQPVESNSRTAKRPEVSNADRIR